jgi:hypothetical protein
MLPVNLVNSISPWAPAEIKLDQTEVKTPFNGLLTHIVDDSDYFKVCTVNS